MKQPQNNISSKSAVKLKLILLPPKQQDQITREKIVNFYSELIKIYTCSDQY